MKKLNGISVALRAKERHNEEHVALLQRGAWNTWRASNPDISPNLRGIQLKGQELRFIDLSQAHLEGADLRNMSLEHVNLHTAHLEGANLAGSYLGNSNLSKASLRSVDLFEATLFQVDLSDADLSLANLRQIHFLQGTLQRASITDADISDAFLREVDFHYADLTGTSLRASQLTEVKLQYANLSRVVLSDAILHNVQMHNSIVKELVSSRVQSDQVEQNNLRLSNNEEPLLMVDGLVLAQWISLWLESPLLRQNVLACSSRIVLLLGNFAADRLHIIADFQQAIRKAGYVPLVYSIDNRPDQKQIESLHQLLHLCSFLLTDQEDALLALLQTMPEQHTYAKMVLKRVTEEYTQVHKAVSLFAIPSTELALYACSLGDI